MRSAAKAQLSFEHRIGLGNQPSVIPPGDASIAGDYRTVEIGWHPVPGGEWLAKKTFIGKAITKQVGKYPDPSQHWGVIVGGYVHQLWMVSLEAVCRRKQIVVKDNLY